jgi:Flp pilus assembly pilin Flp
MRSMIHKLVKACGAESEIGEVAIQYALLATMVALVLVPLASWLGEILFTVFLTIAGKFGG